MHFIVDGKGIHLDSMVQVIPTPYLYTRKEGPKRGMGPDKIQDHGIIYPTNHAELGSRMEYSIK